MSRKMNSLALFPVPQTDLAALDERARTYAEAARADRTQRAYRSDMAHFKQSTCAHGETWLPATPGTVADYICELAETLRPATIIRRVAAIAIYHRLAGSTRRRRTASSRPYSKASAGN
jgi:site-specific recombinase XerD